MLLETRGDIFSMPVENGVVRNLTESSGVAERYPAASPDGKWVAYFSDHSGEYELCVRPADGKGAEIQVTKLGPGYRYQPQIGYIYMLNTGTEGQNQLVRQFRAQVHKPGLIIDERWNGGGQIPDRFVEILSRKVTSYYAVRDGRDWQSPSIAHSGPKAMSPMAGAAPAAIASRSSSGKWASARSSARAPGAASSA